MIANFKILSLLVAILLYGNIAKAQINTPSPTVPLNCGSYPNATILPTNAVASDATNAYNTWKSEYVASCGGSPNQYRVKFDDPSQTVSEGIGYGMLLAAYAGDQDLFNGLWTYYKANMNGNGMMNWKIGGCSGTSGSNGATDADEDAAMALIVAAYQWPSATSPYTYKNEANTLITNINKCEIDKKTTPNFQPSAGDGWIVCNTGSGNGCRNPSYMAPAYYTCWAASPYVTSPQPTASWSTIATASYTLLNANVSSKGLVSDWSDPNGAINTCNGGVSGFGYDASRNPWRMAVASAWYGDASARAICNNIATSTQAATPALVGGPVVPPTNNPTGTHNATFVSMLACGTFGSTTGTQAHINAMYSQLLSTVDAGAGTANPSGYFGNTLRVISIFFATKNFWNPCNVTNTCSSSSCKTPNLGADLNTCSGTTLPTTLNANAGASGGSISYKWYTWNGSTATVIAGQTSQTYSATTTGGYIVERDSTATPTCSRYDTIYITSTLLKPSLGSDPNICGSASLILSASNAASFPGGTTWQWQSSAALGGPYTNIGGQTSSSTTISTVAYYKLIATSGGCTNSDTIHINNTLVNPTLGPDVNLCNPASVNLSPTNLASFPGGTTWMWQSSSAAGGPYTTITGQTSSTYSFVRTANYYKLVATATSCTSSDTIRVTSNLPTPVDACGTGTVTLSITNAGAGPYNWYDAASGGTLKCTGVTSCAITSPTTLYVQDMGSVSGSVGPTTMLANTMNWGVNTGLQLLFTASQNFTITSMQIPMITYNTTPFTVTVDILDATGATVETSVTSQTSTGPCNCTQTSLMTFTFSPGITVNQSSWGSNLRMRLSAVGGGQTPLWNQNAGSYPYNSSPSGIASITGATGGGGATDYMYFYNWQISTGGTSCARLPVVASNSGCSTSPVELFSFYSEERNGDVALLWATASEKNNDYFEAERSLDGKNFTAIGKVKGNGNSGTVLYYEFVDEYPVFGTSYYRLKQVDFDGSFEYSSVVSVARQDLTSLNVVPNPFTNETSINVFTPVQENIELKLLDLSGKEVYSGIHNSNENISAGAGLPSGVYIITVVTGDRIYHSKMVKN
jgi:endo-1,4-beta-D-glucanase Y